MRLVIALALSLLFGCGSKSKGADTIREGTELELQDCVAVGRVNANGSDEFDSKNGAKKKAAALGATHILWVVPCCTYVEGNAYRCDAPDEP
jgi:hypothetical protein